MNTYSGTNTEAFKTAVSSVVGNIERYDVGSLLEAPDKKEVITTADNLIKKLLSKKNNIFTMVKRIKLKVEILIRSAGDIPLYETLKYKKLKERIIEPFERAMNEIKETKGIGISSWEYCGKLGKKVHVNDFKKKYKDYKNLYVIIEFDNNAQPHTIT